MPGSVLSLPSAWKRLAWEPRARGSLCKRPTTSAPSEPLALRRSAACNQSRRGGVPDHRRLRHGRLAAGQTRSALRGRSRFRVRLASRDPVIPTMHTMSPASTSATVVVMGTVGLRELRQDASDLVRRVQAGEEITITVSGRPSARLVPAQPIRWRSWTEIEELFRGPADSDWPCDRDLVDDEVRDPWAAR